MLSILTLKNEKTSEYYDILRKKTHSIARTGFKGDLEIPGDLSVSRSHGEISLIKERVGCEIKLYLKVVDTNSKFGTFINDGIIKNEKIASDCPINLESGDKIRFGAMDSIWAVENYYIVVCPSTLKMVDKEILKKSIKEIGGQVTREWSDQCTHLCMNSITVTEKVLLCLASAKSIVPVKYFSDLCLALSPGSMKELPFHINYKPDLVEKLLNPTIVSLDVNNKRRSLFYGKTFVCSSEKQLNDISKIVKSASGEIINYFDNIESDYDILNNNNFIVMQQDPTNIEDKYEQFLEKLDLIKKRPIPVNDIGLAIIYSSTEKHCNPYYNKSLVNLQSQSTEIKSQASIVLAPETEVLTVESSEIFSVNVVPDSLPQTQGCFKRPLEEKMDSEEIVMPKKRCVLSHDKGKNNSIKITVEKDAKSIKIMPEPTQSTSKLTFEASESNKTVFNNKSTNIDSCLTTVPSSLDITNENYSITSLQHSIAKNNLNSRHNAHSKTFDNNVTAKRKIPSVCSMFDNEDDDPFNYMDVDEIEEHTSKKPKVEHIETIFHPMLALTSNNEKEQSKSVEPKTNNAVDPNFIMNLLSTAKGTNKFIDASKVFDNSSVSVSENDDFMLNTVIVQTINMVVSKPTQTQNIIQGSHPNLMNFKKFKKKGPAMRIPYIVPLELCDLN